MRAKSQSPYTYAYHSEIDHIDQVGAFRRSLPVRLAIRAQLSARWCANGYATGLLSRDERVRDVARRWRALSAAERDQTDIEELCEEAGMRESDYLGAVISTAFELNINVSAVIGGITRMPMALIGAFGSAGRSVAGRERAVEAIEFFNRRLRKSQPARR